MLHLLYMPNKTMNIAVAVLLTATAALLATPGVVASNYLNAVDNEVESYGLVNSDTAVTPAIPFPRRGRRITPCDAIETEPKPNSWENGVAVAPGLFNASAAALLNTTKSGEFLHSLTRAERTVKEGHAKQFLVTGLCKMMKGV